MSSNRDTKKTKVGADLISTEEILSLPSNEVLSRLAASPAGLTTEEVTNRLETYGFNEVARKGKRAAPIEFLLHFRSPLVIILIIAAIVSGVLGELINATIILSIVLMSVILDFTQEYRAERTAEELRRRVATTATTFRNGTKQDIEVSELVPGDIVALSAEDIVPADARIISARDFFVDQSALTGESFPAATIATDNVDLELIEQPRRLEAKFIRNFMIIFGLVSSLFDYLTFVLLLFVLHLQDAPALFRTAWFIESLMTELFIALVVRTRRLSFRSKPGRYLLISTVAITVLTFIIPYLPFSRMLAFVPLPPWLMVALLGITLFYVIAVEATKRFFYARAG